MPWEKTYEMTCMILDLNLHLMDDKDLTYLYYKVRAKIPKHVFHWKLNFPVEKYENI